MNTPESIVDIPIVSLPAWSADSASVAYLLDEAANGWRLWRCDLGDGAQTRLSEWVLVGSRPAWSPDGRWLAVVRRGEGGRGHEIWLVAADGSGEARRLVASGAEARSARFSPDGEQVAYLCGEAGAMDVWCVRTDGSGAPRQLTEGTNPLDEPRWTPRWSPDGRWLAYVSSRSGERNNDDLWLVAADGAPAPAQHFQLTTGLLVSTDPDWSPDGRHLAFTANTAVEHWYGDDLDLWQVSVEPAPPRRLSATGGHSRNEGAAPAYSPDGRLIYAITLANGNKNVTATSLAKLTGTGGDLPVRSAATNLQGSVTDFVLSPDGAHLAVIFGQQTAPADLYLIPTAGGRPRRLTRCADAVAATLAAPERVPYRADDGLYCDAYLYLPPGFDPTRRYPGLIQVHGGGTNAYGNGWHPVEQYLAQNGFVVMAIEYRGSSGYGRAFAGLSYGDWGGGQTDDTVAAGRWLKAQPYIGKIGIYGGSYGGYMSLHGIVADPDLFDAACDMYGMTNKLTGDLYADRVGRLFVARDYWGRKPGEIPAAMARASTVDRLDRIRTPLLIQHGQLDKRVPLEQSEQVIAAMQQNNLPHDYVIYPGEGHGFRQRAHRIDSYRRLLAWFREHLVSGG